MSNVTNKIFVDKMGGTTSAEFIGQPGEIFYDPDNGSLRLGDGSTMGGKGIGGVATTGARVALWVGSVDPEVYDWRLNDTTEAMYPTNLMDRIFNGSWDDDWYEISTPFTVGFLGQTYDMISVGTNSYLTFGGSTDNYNFGDDPTMDGANLPAVLISENDNSFQRVYTATTGDAPNRTFYVRYEGSSATGGQIGGPTIVWQARFYEGDSVSGSNVNFIIDREHSQDIGDNRTISGITDGTNWVGTPRSRFIPWSQATLGDVQYPTSSLVWDDQAGTYKLDTPPVTRYLETEGNDGYNITPQMHGKFIQFRGTAGNATVYVPEDGNSDNIAVGFTLTLILDDFGSNRVYVESGSGNVTILANGQNAFGNRYWYIGGDGNAGVYTLMKIDDNRWMLSGPTIVNND